jgi:hypothetical protein
VGLIYINIEVRMWKDKSKSWRGFEKAEEMSNGPEVARILQRSFVVDGKDYLHFLSLELALWGP